MSSIFGTFGNLPLEQQRIRARCFHPTGNFTEFRKEEIEQSIPDRFEQQVRRYPERLAVKTRDHSLTYSELNQTANRLADTIIARRGTGSEPVALLLERGAPLISAYLGVLKAGKLYVPLDPSFPDSRIKAMFKDSQARTIITNSRNLTFATQLAAGTELLNLDEVDDGLSAEDPGLNISPDAHSYILYTSGSTGQPKGVVQNHRNVLHYIRSYTNDHSICAEDRHTLLLSYFFSGAMRNIYGALLNGAALLPYSIEEQGMGQLANWMMQEGITLYHSIPTVFRRLVSTLTAEQRFPKLRSIYMGGEPLSKRDVDLYKKHFSDGCIFVNALGSTELNSIRKYFIDRETHISASTVPVGYAVEDAEVLLLNDGREEVGANQIGEIAVKSPYLAPGYWHQPELTRAKFLPDPQGGDAPIYLTGDLGRTLPDGCLEHLGRKDLQVKVRGFRVELAEIEDALLDHPMVGQAVVLATEGQSGEPRLVAYVVSKGQQGLPVSELRKFLNDRLPDYMIPSVFMNLEALPLTLSGKIDRRALPKPEHVRPELSTLFVSARTAVEKTLVQIWIEALGLDEVGIHDNFFELGGHSLLASDVMSRVQEAFQVRLPLHHFFETTTVAGLAELIETALWTKRSARRSPKASSGNLEEGEL